MALLDFCGIFTCKHRKQAGIERLFRANAEEKLMFKSETEESIRRRYDINASYEIARVREDMVKTVRVYEELIASMKKRSRCNGNCKH